MSDYIIDYSELDTLLGSLDENTRATAYSIEIPTAPKTFLTGSRPAEGEARDTLCRVLRGNPHKYVEITLGENCEANCWGLFQACESLTSVTMICPSGGNVSWMFSGCTNLASVELTSIPDARDAEGMFASCDSLKLVSLPDMPSLTEAPRMFYSCGLEAISLPDMPRLQYAEYMFENCFDLKSIVLGDYPVLRDASGMFYYCRSLKTVTLPPGNYVVAGMFYNCSSLETVYGWAKDYNDPNSAYGIDHNGQARFIFQNCDSLTAIYVRKDDSHPQDSSSWRSFLVSHGSGTDDTVTVYATDGTVEASATVTNADGRSVEATDWVDELVVSDEEIPGAKVADMMATRIPITGAANAVDPSVDNFVLWSKDGDRKKTNLHMSDLRNDLSLSDFRNDLSLSDFRNDLSLSDFTNDLVLPVGRPANVRPGSVWLG